MPRSPQLLPLLLTAAMLSGTASAQGFRQPPRVVLNIIVDQLRADYLDRFSPLYVQGGLRKLISGGVVYEAAHYPFVPVDRASAVATIGTGAGPRQHGIVAARWLDRTTLKTVACTDDATDHVSPAHMAVSCLGDELKIATQGSAVVYAIAPDCDAAVLAGGHCPNGALWLSAAGQARWDTSTYYAPAAAAWVKALNSLGVATGVEAVQQAALACLRDQAIGRDDTPDMLTVCLSAKASPLGRLMDTETTYRQVDKAVAALVGALESAVGKDRLLVMLTSTGYVDEQPADYRTYRVPTGTFYINRGADLLNMYLGAIYGTAKYVEAVAGNQIYINRRLLEQRNIHFAELFQRSHDFLLTLSGVSDVQVSPYPTDLGGDLVITVRAGWQLINEQTNETITARAGTVPFPIIFYGMGLAPERVIEPVSTDRIAPTIAKAIQIRAPNACAAQPLF